MRLTIFLLISGCLAVNASGYAQKVSLSARNATIESVCLDIKKQTGYFFLYDVELLKKSGRVTVDLKNAELGDALKQVTSGKSLSYRIIDKTVIISEIKDGTNQDGIIVKGTVRSLEIGKTNATMPGVIVTIKGTKKIVATFADGTYSILAPANGTLVFSMIGYVTKEVPVSGKQRIDVVMNESASDLQEVIITGYGTSERKENQVGSAFQVTRKDLDRKPLDRIDRLLEGVVPGLQFEPQQGTATAARPRYQTRIRGEGSFSASGDPLWVVDGIPLNTGNETNAIPGVNTSISPLTYMNPNDIESVTVLKDATATSIYGANGSNGVILITTKRGKAGVDRLNYSFRTGLNILTNNRFQVLNASEYRELLGESFANSTLAINPVIDNGTSTDWYDEFFRNGVTTQHDLSLSGGNEKTRYYISGAYMNEKPIMISNLTQRFSTRVNIDQKVNRSIDMFFRLGVSRNINKMFDPGDSYYNNRPIDSPYNPDGSFVIDFYNRLNNAKFDEDQQKTTSLNGNLGGSIRILPELIFTTTNGIDTYSIDENRYESMYTKRGQGVGYAYRAQSTNFAWNSQQRLNFDKTLNSQTLSAMLGVEASNENRSSVGASGSGFANDNIREINFATNTGGTSSSNENSKLSYYGQLKYSFLNKYNLVGSFRGDGNSDFGTDVQWATFKSIGASWTISNEKFWKIKQIDFAKLKLSYGTNGNSRIGSFRGKGLYTFGTQYGYNGEAGTIMSTGENPVLSWETTYIINGGISIGLFKRISIEMEAYQNTTKNLLDELNISRTGGFTQIFQNLGSMRNKGIELTLNTQNIQTENFHWNTSFNLAHNKNKVLKLYNNEDIVNDLTINRVGKDANTYYLIRWAGVDPRDGGPLWYDARGNITKEFNIANRVAVGTSTPDVFGGMTNTFQYKEFSLAAQLIYTVGGYKFSNLQRDSETDGRNIAVDNQSRNQLDRWREPGDVVLVPKTILNENANNGRNSTRFLHEKTSLRLQNISMAYVLPEKFAKSIRMQNASVYLQADNVGFWTPYKTRSDRNDYKNSFTAYPQPLVLSFGVNVGL